MLQTCTYFTFIILHTILLYIFTTLNIKNYFCNRSLFYVLIFFQPFEVTRVIVIARIIFNEPTLKNVTDNKIAVCGF